MLKQRLNPNVTWPDIFYCVVFFGSIILQLYLLYNWTNVGRGMSPTILERVVIMGIGCISALYTIYKGFIAHAIPNIWYVSGSMLFGWKAMVMSVIYVFFAIVPAAMLVLSV